MGLVLLVASPALAEPQGEQPCTLHPETILDCDLDDRPTDMEFTGENIVVPGQSQPIEYEAPMEIYSCPAGPPPCVGLSPDPNSRGPVSIDDELETDDWTPLPYGARICVVVDGCPPDPITPDTEGDPAPHGRVYQTHNVCLLVLIPVCLPQV